MAKQHDYKVLKKLKKVIKKLKKTMEFLALFRKKLKIWGF